MKIFMLLILVVFTNAISADELKGVLSAFIHAKCKNGEVEALLVLENNTPYKIDVLENGQISETQIYPDMFSIYDAEKLNAYKSGSGDSRDVLLKASYEANYRVKPQLFHFEPFEKKAWVYKNLDKHYKLMSGRDYVMKVVGIGLNIRFDDGVIEYAVLGSNSFIVPSICYTKSRE